MRLRELRERAGELGFTPQDQVRWLSPAQIGRTAIKVGLSTLFADYADRREVQAALADPALALPAGAADADGPVWVDFVADLGDGFDATYSVAWLLAQPRLRVAGADGGVVDLPRGDLLVLGGDEVYPTSSAVGYEDRTKGPYRAALPASAVLPGPAPTLLALPGNHDWYDGLTAFLRVFTQQRPIGGWRTVQTRSYFAVELPHRWWLVGVDTQLGTYIDGPQITYFRKHLSAHLQPGDGVIVCAPAPTWVRTAEGEPDAFNSLRWFAEHVVTSRPGPDGQVELTGATVRLWLTGDYHHYARYEEELDGAEPGAARQLVTCGLGGSFVSETHRLPEQLILPAPDSRTTTVDEPSARFTLRSRYPSAAASRRLVAGVLSLGSRGAPMRNPGLWQLCGAIQALLVLALANVLALELGSTPVGALRAGGLAEVAALAGQATVWFAVLVAFAALVPLVRLRPPQRPPEIFLAAGLQLVVAFGGLAGAAAVPWPAGLAPWQVLGLALAGVGVAGGLVSAYAFALYLLASRNRTVRGWQLSAQAIEDHKGFLRLRIDPDGTVALHPIVIDTVCRDWAVQGARPVPAGRLDPRLVEPPVVVRRA